MPKVKISDYSQTAASNTDINSINLGEGMLPSDVNNAIRELMKQLKDFQVGAQGDPMTVGGSFVASGGMSVTTMSATGIFTASGGTILSGTNTMSGSNIISGNINSSGTTNTFSGGNVLSGTNTLSGSNIISGNINSSGTNTFSGSQIISGSINSSGSTNTFSGNTIFSVNSSSDAVRITQTGAGNALVVEDSTNPDSTPFVVDTSGQVLMGLTTARNTFSGGAVAPAVQIEQVTGGRLSVTRNSANSTAPDFIFGKTRGTALNAVDAVASGDNLGTISFQGADGTNLISAANIVAAVDGTPGTNDMPGRLVFSTTADGASSPTERMRITNAGNALIGGTAVRGTTVGSAHLDIFNGTAPAGTLTNGISLYSSSGDFNFMDSSGNGYKVGYRNVPAVGTKTGSYTLAVGDVGKYVQVGSGGSITIPDATFAEGDVVSVFNNTTGNITITCSITTAYIAGTDTDKASVTLATRGVATILFISSTVCVITGNVS